jgi:hypothetical protein
MVVGAALFAVTMLLVALRVVRTNRGALLGVLTPRIERLPAAPGEEPAATLAREIVASGYEALGAWQVDLLPEPSARRSVRTLLAHASQDRKTEADVTVLRAISDERGKGVFATTFMTFRSVDASGRLAITYNFPLPDTLEDHPIHSVRRYPALTSARALEGAHRAHVAAIGLVPVPVDPADYERRYLERHCHGMWHLEAKKLVRLDGVLARGTLRFGIRQAWLLLQPAGFERRRGVMVLALAAIGGAGALLALGVGRRVPVPDRDLAATAVFVALALTCVATFRLTKIQATGYACLPAAVVFFLAGVRVPWPWVAALVTSTVLSVLVHRARYRRVKAQLAPQAGA